MTDENLWILALRDAQTGVHVWPLAVLIAVGTVALASWISRPPT